MSNNHNNKIYNINHNQIIIKNKSNIIKKFYENANDNSNKNQRIGVYENSESLEKNKIFNSNQNIISNRVINENNYDKNIQRGNSLNMNIGDKNCAYNNSDGIRNIDKITENSQSKINLKTIIA